MQLFSIHYIKNLGELLRKENPRNEQSLYAEVQAGPGLSWVPPWILRTAPPAHPYPQRHLWAIGTRELGTLALGRARAALRDAGDEPVLWSGLC